MPIPKPKDGEAKDEFISRCMGDAEMQEYDKDQRLAICYNSWKEGKEDKTMTPPADKREREVRAFAAELRVDDGDQPKIRGHAAIFNKLSTDLGGYQEKIKPGAFVNALTISDVRALWNHDPSIVLGRQKSGTLVVQEDEKGLYFEITPPSWAKNYLETIKRGDVTGASFAFIIAEGGDTWEQKNGEPSIRTITEIGELFDVSPVAYPAYPHTDVKVRLADKDIEEIAVRLSHTIGSASQPTTELGAQGAAKEDLQHAGNLDILRKRLDIAEIQ